MFYAVASFVIGLLMRIVTRLEVRGVENVPIDGPLLVAANHLHIVDPPLLGAVLPRRVVFMAKSEVFRTFPLNVIIRAYSAVSVRRGQADTRAIRGALKVMADGLAFGIFPEGTRSKDGRLQPAHIGAAMLALRADAAILPIGITGTRGFLKWPRIVQRPRVTVTIGKPFRPEVDATLPSRRQQVMLTNVVMRRIAELLPEEQRGVYGLIGPDGEPVEVAVLDSGARATRAGKREERAAS